MVTDGRADLANFVADLRWSGMAMRRSEDGSLEIDAEGRCLGGSRCAVAEAVGVA